jgi:hypothetical protein
MPDASPHSRGDVAARDVQRLHRLLDRLRRDDGALAVADVIWYDDRLRVFGHLVAHAGVPAPFAVAAIRCGSGARPIHAGMKLRLWRDKAGAHLEHCIP